MSEQVFGLIPVRGFIMGKSRLAAVLAEAEREQLIRDMLATVLGAALDTSQLAEVAVISPDPAVLAFASGVDSRVVPIIQDAGHAGLNPAITLGRERAMNEGADRLLVLFGDLPLVRPAAIRAFIARAADVVLAADRHGTGTNASLIRLDGRGGSFVYQYGAGSLQRHVGEADRLGLTAEVLTNPALATDLDTVEDLAALRESISRVSGYGDLLIDASPVGAAWERPGA